MALSTGAALLALLTLSDALAFPDATIGPGYVHVPVQRRQDVNKLEGRSTASTASVDLANAQNAGYMVNISIGTPGQNTMVVLDTGSIELWVDPDCSNARFANVSDETNGVDNPDADPNYCSKIGRYDPSASTSATSPGLAGTVFQYADFTTTTINYWQDTVSIAGVSVANQIFGVANASNQTSSGILGIGPSQLGFNHTPEYPYPLLLSNLKTAGAIQSRAFSLDLRDFDNTTGSLLFGGVDKSKYSGSLQTVPFETVAAKYSDGSSYTSYSYWVKVTSMSLTPAGGKSSSAKSYTLPGGNFIADLDSGTSALLLPSGLTDAICADVGGLQATSGGTCVTNCTMRGLGGGLTFGFGSGGASVTVSYENLFETLVQQGTTFCYLAASTSTIVSSPETYILGAPFLRSAYAVFDWDNQNVHLAQAASCGSSSDIVAIGTGANAVPTGDGNCKSSTSSSSAPRSAAGRWFGVLTAVAAVVACSLLL